jgi:hypothetical protein
LNAHACVDPDGNVAAVVRMPDGDLYEPYDRDVALSLFKLANVIVRSIITEQKLIEKAYSEIPQNKKDRIE